MVFTSLSKSAAFRHMAVVQGLIPSRFQTTNEMKLVVKVGD